MEPNKSQSLDWKICFKKILAPHLLNPVDTEEQNDASLPLSPLNSEEQNGASSPLNSTNSEKQKDNVSTSAFLKDPEKFDNVQKNVNSSIAVESVYIDDNSRPFVKGFFHCRDLESTYGKLDNTENPIEKEEDVARIIAADAEELAKNFKALKVRKKDKYFFNMAENIRNPPDWNIAFKQVLDPKFNPENSLKTTEVVNDVPKVSHPELLDNFEANPESHHRLSKEKPLKKGERAAAKSSSKKSKKKRSYSKEEMEILEILNSARRFKPLRKSSMNDFEGAGVNCFKYKESSTKNKSLTNEKPKNVPPPNGADEVDVNSSKYKESECSTKNKSPKTEKPKNVCPPNGWVCVKPITMEDARKLPPNLIFSECWDWDEDDW